MILEFKGNFVFGQNLLFGCTRSSEKQIKWEANQFGCTDS